MVVVVADSVETAASRVASVCNIVCVCDAVDSAACFFSATNDIDVDDDDDHLPDIRSAISWKKSCSVSADTNPSAARIVTGGGGCNDDDDDDDDDCRSLHSLCSLYSCSCSCSYSYWYLYLYLYLYSLCSFGSK